MRGDKRLIRHTRRSRLPCLQEWTVGSRKLTNLPYCLKVQNLDNTCNCKIGAGHASVIDIVEEQYSTNNDPRAESPMGQQSVIPIENYL
ncbi:MAG TPA: hypothetical protein ENI20_06405 [Bacteroides sp.]|nr:hypothetical protein [Bacteroides sp.]